MTATPPSARPDDAFARALHEAQRLQQARDPAAAARLLAPFAASHADEPALHRALARIAAQAGDTDAALRHLASARRLAPRSGLLACEAGRLLAGAGRMDEALRAFHEASTLEPGLAEAWFFLGITLVRANRPAEAAPALRRALALAPAQPDILAALADLEFRAANDEDGLPLWRQLVALRPTDEDACLKLGETLSRLGQHPEARAAYAAGLARMPASAGLWMALAQAEEDAGHPEAAEQAYRRSLDLRPGWAFPIAGLLGLKRGRAEPGWVAQAQALQASTALDDAERAMLGYPLGKVFDARGEHAAAFASWSDANAARRREHGPLDRTQLARRVEQLRARFAPGALDGLPVGSDDARPVFVVGMPRSGTTLVEQIIASHPQAAGCGELPDMAQLGAQLATEAATDAAGPLHDAARLAREARRYLAVAQRHGRPGALRLVDKAPLNFFHLGLVAQLFPRARIVWCRRDARDVGLSIFGENFALGAQFSTDLGDIAHYVNAQHALMRHWQRALALEVLEVDYAALVSDIDPQSRRLIAFLGLPWDDACLAFHATERAVQTPSRWQVRAPAHTGSIARWKPYAAWLGPLVEALDVPAASDGGLST